MGWIYEVQSVFNVTFEGRFDKWCLVWQGYIITIIASLNGALIFTYLTYSFSILKLLFSQYTKYSLNKVILRLCSLIIWFLHSLPILTSKKRHWNWCRNSSCINSRINWRAVWLMKVTILYWVELYKWNYQGVVYYYCIVHAGRAKLVFTDRLFSSICRLISYYVECLSFCVADAVAILVSNC